MLRVPSLYSRAIIMGYKGAKNTQINHTSLLQIEGVATPADTQFYLGKVCASFACLLRPRGERRRRRCGRRADVLRPPVSFSQRVAYVYTAQEAKAKVRGKATKVRSAPLGRCLWAQESRSRRPPFLTVRACCAHRHG